MCDHHSASFVDSGSEAHPRDWVGGKGGRKAIRTDGMNKIGSGPIRVKGSHSYIDQRPTFPNKSSTIEETKSLCIYKSRLEIWSWKDGVDVAGGIMVNT